MVNQEHRPNPELPVDFSKAAELPSGFQVLNYTPHQIIFREGERDIIVEPCGAKLSARAREKVVQTLDEQREIGGSGSSCVVEIVQTTFEPSGEGLQELEQINTHDPKLLVVGSIISAQAYPGKVYALIPTVGFERVPVEQKRMNPNKFTSYGN